MTRGLRIPFFSPLPPEESGIADYALEVIEELARDHHVEVFTRHPDRARSRLPGDVRPRAYDEYDPGSGADIPVYQLGNHAGFHGEILRIALQQPGLVVLHELVLHDLVREEALRRGGLSAYREELRYALGTTGESLARRVSDDGERLPSHPWPLFERVVDRSRATVVHGRAACARLRASRPAAPVTVVPHLVRPPNPSHDTGVELRRSLGIPTDALVLGAFGVVADSKRLDQALSAFDTIVRESHHAHFLLVGEGGERWLQASSPPPAAAGKVHALGRVREEELTAAMATTDIAFNLRHPTGWETSGTCLRLLALGRPVLVTNAGWFAEIPDDCCVKIDADAYEQRTLVALVRTLAKGPELRRRIGHNARHWALHDHAPERVVAGYEQALELAAAAPVPPVRPSPPLAPWSHDDVLTELVAQTTRALGDLGITEEDDTFLFGLAQTIAGLAGAEGRGDASGGKRR